MIQTFIKNNCLKKWKQWIFRENNECQNTIWRNKILSGKNIMIVEKDNKIDSGSQTIICMHILFKKDIWMYIIII